MGVHKEAALRQNVGVQVVVGDLVQNGALGARAHAVQAWPGQGSAAGGAADAWFEAHLRETLPQQEVLLDVLS